MKILIAYFSRRGQNYGNGGLVNLAKGNTEIVAESVQKLVGGDIFRIETVKEYPADYEKTTQLAQVELKEQARPQLKNYLDDICDYTTVFLGYPNWWGTMPMAVCSLLERHDFGDKTILPFCTNEGSGLGHSEGDIRKLCPKARVLRGLSLRGSTVKESSAVIESWIEDSGIRY